MAKQQELHPFAAKSPFRTNTYHQPQLATSLIYLRLCHGNQRWLLVWGCFVQPEQPRAAEGGRRRARAKAGWFSCRGKREGRGELMLKPTGFPAVERRTVKGKGSRAPWQQGMSAFGKQQQLSLLNCSQTDT